MAKNQIRVHEIPSAQFIEQLALKLKQKPEFKQPEWALFVKTGQAKQRPPEDADWWYVRAASILRSLYTQGIIGVERLRSKYGSRKKRGMAPERFKKSSGKIIRTIMQQATKAGIVEHIKEKKSGRKLTKQGKEWLESIASEMKSRG